jgi:hypothetical protein
VCTPGDFQTATRTEGKGFDDTEIEGKAELIMHGILTGRGEQKARAQKTVEAQTVVTDVSRPCVSRKGMVRG